ncbi:hypothetical protein Tco_0971223 [Tanacetum coccineum]
MTPCHCPLIMSLVGPAVDPDNYSRDHVPLINCNVLEVVGLPACKTHHAIRGRFTVEYSRAGFETSATTYIPRATVRVECKDKDQKIIYTKDGTTDATGTYHILINEDHREETCDVALVSSPLDDCKTADPGRDRARVALTSYNGIDSKKQRHPFLPMPWDS